MDRRFSSLDALVRDIKLTHKLIISNHMKRYGGYSFHQNAAVHRAKRAGRSRWVLVGWVGASITTEHHHYCVYSLLYLWWMPIINVCMKLQFVGWMQTTKAKYSVRWWCLTAESNGTKSKCFAFGGVLMYNQITFLVQHDNVSKTFIWFLLLLLVLLALLALGLSIHWLRFNIPLRCPIDIALALHIQSTTAKLASWNIWSKWTKWKRCAPFRSRCFSFGLFVCTPLNLSDSHAIGGKSGEIINYYGVCYVW